MATIPVVADYQATAMLSPRVTSPGATESLVSTANAHSSNITMTCLGKTLNMKSIMEMTRVRSFIDNEVIIAATGSDAQIAVDAVIARLNHI